ncbi:DUF1217 domain-containing protein [Tropicimonas sp. IMCC6043]|uniref:DUF1217 domain-containing protein n=1 Tax=Tropicimonas sp. IMCC6043 TaxID=2510645 RepID=UPI001F5D03BF|nr:DUF1217 domain-containing protein [Tropicimonas sp. IMCC6043]
MFLSRTLETQQATHKEGLTSDTEYFAEKIGEVRTVDDLMKDRRLLRVALGAFGLGEDVRNTYFIRKVLEEGVSNPDSLANKLSDKSYHALSEAFGFGAGEARRTGLAGFAEEISKAYELNRFEIDVGEQNDDFRLALNAQRELAELAKEEMGGNAKWYTIMGSPPLRAVFETALGLPSSLAALDIDEQLTIFQEKLERKFGSGDIAQFAEDGKTDKLVQTFLLQSELKQGVQSMSPASAALILVSGR